ncbi:MAG TPA: KEOPS complex subunit Pcc1 [Thermoplasmata archaeon]|nr:KEOPS complex subunit Pcc1 [Thermoplasmata archaeon]
MRTAATAAVAARLAAAVAADNPPFVRVTVDGPTLTVRVDGRSAASVRATLDDLLACLLAAERTIGAASEDRPSQDA